MGNLNEKCCYVVNCNMGCGAFSFELQTKIEKQSKIYIEEINKQINDDLINMCLGNVNDNYFVLLYLIIYESEFTEKYKEKIVSALLEHMNDKHINPILSILMMETELTDGIVEKIIKITNKEYLEHHVQELGNKPFDYRYHILKRKEISNELKQIILERYHFNYGCGYDDEVTKIYYDIQAECISKNITSKEDINKCEGLADELRAYRLLKKQKNI